jgi:hypothetical protein
VDDTMPKQLKKKKKMGPGRDGGGGKNVYRHECEGRVQYDT